jgi:hypothetical protein
MNPRGGGNAIVLLKPAGRDDISDALLEIVDDVISTTKTWRNKRLQEYCHTALKECKRPPIGGGLRIEAEEILIGADKSEAQIRRLQAESVLWSNFEAAVA